jgi:hypothetical protein
MRPEIAGRARALLIATLALAALVAGCATTQHPAAAPPAQPPPTAPMSGAATTTAAPAGFPFDYYERGGDANGRVYRIASAESQLDIYVYRAGRFARLGHNHIVTSRDVTGFAQTGDDPTHSRFDLYFPVDKLSVDEPELRAAAGDDFASQPSESDIAGTRKNMLGEKMLDAAQFPFVVVSGRGNGGTASAPEFDLSITVRGITHPVHAPATFARAGDAWTATGEVRLSHAELGLEPFSVLGGALSVQDEFVVRYRITARPR